MDDFVGISTRPLDIYSLEPLAKKSEIETNERLKRSRKVLFLGGAGIGKTTYFRYTILKILHDKSKVEFLREKENPVPFYVALKGVKNTAQFPIVKDILHSNTFLSTRSKEAAIKKLIELAKAERLFLFLDGYDEIQFAGGQSNGAGFIQKELNIMMATESFPRAPYQSEDIQFKELYDALSLCRIWLSCRKEFFEQHSINMVAPDDYKTQTVSALKLDGIGDNRMTLVENVFDKYRGEKIFSKYTDGAKTFADIFDAEFFVKEIDTSPEKELKELSFNPLFLTIMSFIYAKKAIREERYDVKWSGSFNELITICIGLLLNELDKGKMSDLPEARRAALIRRRGEFIKEKEDFLHYFAYRLFKDGEKVFTINFIIDIALKFFEKYSRSNNSSSILTGLKDYESDDNPHLVWQLAYTGIFVIVKKQDGDFVYDFPHLRFREVLAAEYFIEHKDDYLIDNIGRENLSELLYVYFNRSKAQDKVLDTIFFKLKNLLDADFYNSLLINCLRRKPIEYDPNMSIRKFLLDCLDGNAFFSTRLEALQHFNYDEDFGLLLASKFREGLEKNEVHTLSLSCYLLSLYNQVQLKDLLLTNFLPRFEVSDVLTVSAVLKHPTVSRTIENTDRLNGEQVEFFRIKEIYQSIIISNEGIPIAKERYEYVYIITDEVMKRIQTFITNKRLKLSTDNQTDLDSLAFKVHSSDDFINKIPFALNAEEKALIIENSKFNSVSFNKIMKTIKAIKDDPTLEKDFFV